jgi:hypothetical protein
MKVAPGEEDRVNIVSEQSLHVQQQQQDPEDVELTWSLYCGSGCDCGVFCAQVKKDYKEHNRISILCHGVQYGIFCFVLLGIIFFFIWLANSF